MSRLQQIWNSFFLILLVFFVLCYLDESSAYGYRVKRDTSCPETCKSCNNTKTCDSCEIGFYGERCQERCGCLCDRDGTCTMCSAHRWGSDCSQACAANCGDLCERDTGKCISCKKGYYGPYCSMTCDSKCSDDLYYLSRPKCDKETGVCNACVDGLWGEYCNETCSANCRRCRRQTGECRECNEGYGGDTYCEEDANYTCCSHACTNTRCALCRTFDGRARGSYGPRAAYEYCSICKAGYFGDECRFSDSSLQYCKNLLVDSYSFLEELASGKCECLEGRYGYKCEHTCPENCALCSDAHACTKCKDGFYGSFCNSTCAPGCAVCSVDGQRCQKCVDPDHLGDQCQCRMSECSFALLKTDCAQCKQDNWQPTRNGCCPCSNCNNSCSVLRSGSRHMTCSGGCKPGFYGTACNQTCSPYCNIIEGQATCSDTGDCAHGCLPGYVRPKCHVKCSDVIAQCQNCNMNGSQIICKRCGSGFSPDADGVCRTCSHCMNNDCDTETGRCLSGCSEGYFTNKAISTANDMCESKCSFTCRDSLCDPETGKCKGCRDGFYGKTCQQECSAHCSNVACDQKDSSCSPCNHGYYFEDCRRKCDDRCVNGCNQDGVCTDCAPTNGGDKCEKDCKNCISGKCDRHGGCTSCKPGYSGKYCTDICEKKCFSCSKIAMFSCVKCQSGYWEDFARGYATFCQPCSEGCLNPLASLYNPKQTYTECPIGKYGLSCDKNCPANCKKRSGGDPSGPCDFLTGACSLGCPNGYYGHTCEERCGHCSRTYGGTNICGNSGECDRCQTGYHGATCDEKCSENCIGKECDKVTGACEHGCAEGYKGSFCSRVSSANTIQTAITCWMIFVCSTVHRLFS